MTDKAHILALILEHNEVCRCLLSLVEEENHGLTQSENQSPASEVNASQKRSFLSRLDELKNEIREQREALEREGKTGEGLDEELESAIEDGKRVIMKVVALDRENEKLLLKSGRLQPGVLPAAAAKRPDLVAKTYQTR